MQVVPAADVAIMIQYAEPVVSEGTGTHARLDDVTVAGKTGTTNNYHDAWFCGFTGNFVGAVWFGNDDYSSTNRLTGGALPAMIWHSAMAYAHQGIELKNLPGIPLPPAVSAKPQVAAGEKGLPPPPLRPTVLTKRGTDVLVRIERMMEDAGHALGPVPGEVSELPGRRADAAPKSEAFASATTDSPSGAVRGN